MGEPMEGRAQVRELAKKQRRNIAFVQENRGRLSKEYAGQFVVVADRRVAGAFRLRSEAEACRQRAGEEAVVWFIDDPVQAYVL